MRRVLFAFAIAVLAVLGVLAWISMGRDDAIPGPKPAGSGPGIANRDPNPDNVPHPTRRSQPHPQRQRLTPSDSQDPADPSLPGYDADKVVRANPGSFFDQYHREPRDDPWATRREAFVQSFALARLREVDPTANLEIECHTAICKLRVTTKNQALERWTVLYPLGACLAPTYATTRDGDMYLVFDSMTRDQDGMIDASERCDAEHRDAWKTAVNAGRGPY